MNGPTGRSLLRQGFMLLFLSFAFGFGIVAGGPRARGWLSVHLTASTVPAIDTERLTMHGHALEDFDEYTVMWGNPKVTRHVGGRPFTREECWTRLLRNVGHWQLLGFGYWIVRERASGRFVG